MYYQGRGREETGREVDRGKEPAGGGGSSGENFSHVNPALTRLYTLSKEYLGL